MQNTNSGAMAPPMKRIKHSTVIEEPHGFQNPQTPQGFHGFMQNMVHPAFRTFKPGEDMQHPQPQGPKPMNGVMSPFQPPNPNPTTVAPPLMTPGFHPVAPRPPFMMNPGQMDWGNLLSNMRSGGANPFLLQFLSRMAQNGMR